MPRSPIKWFGGKGLLAKQIISLFPPHTRYVEPFGGGASVLLAKDPVEIEVYNDIDHGLVNFFRILRDPDSFEIFRQKAFLTPHSREEYHAALETWESCTDDIERAYRWYVVAAMSFSGVFGGGFSSSVSNSWREAAGSTAAYLSSVDMLPQIHKRLRTVQVEYQDWRVILQRYNTPGYLAYIDPPYSHGSRKNKRYRCELTDQEHKELVLAMLAYPEAIVLSGYDTPIYKPLMDAGWDRVEIQTSCFATARSRALGTIGKGAIQELHKRTEMVWRNPKACSQREPSVMDLFQ